MDLDGIKPDDLKQSLDSDANHRMIFRAGEGAGASGSFFFFSHDNQFLIKTMARSEMNVFIEMLDQYIKHIKGSYNRSLIARIYGIFTIKTNYFSDVDIMIM